MKIYVSILRKDRGDPSKGEIDIVLGGRTLLLDVESNTTILDLKKMISKKEDIYINEQIIVFNKNILDNEKTLCECSVTNNSFLHQLYYYKK